MATETFIATKDNQLQSNAATTNNSTLTALLLYNANNATLRPIMSFDVSGFVGEVTDINSAKLYLYYYSTYVNDPVGKGVTAYKIRRNDWVESESTWNIYKTGSSWGTAGASNTTNDIDTTLSGSVNMPASYGWVEIDITDIVKDAITNVSGIVNILLKYTDEDEAAKGAIFYSKEYSDDTSLRPKLVIEYTTGSTSNFFQMF